MPWPKDPERRALAMERHKAAQRAKWTPERRAEASRKASERNATPEYRAWMSQQKAELYDRVPELRQRIASTLRDRGEGRRKRKAVIAALAKGRRS